MLILTLRDHPPRYAALSAPNSADRGNADGTHLAHCRRLCHTSAASALPPPPPYHPPSHARYWYPLCSAVQRPLRSHRPLLTQPLRLRRHHRPRLPRRTPFAGAYSPMCDTSCAHVVLSSVAAPCPHRLPLPLQASPVLAALLGPPAAASSHYALRAPSSPRTLSVLHILYLPPPSSSHARYCYPLCSAVLRPLRSRSHLASTQGPPSTVHLMSFSPFPVLLCRYLWTLAPPLQAGASVPFPLGLGPSRAGTLPITLTPYLWGLGRCGLPQGLSAPSALPYLPTCLL